MNSFFQQLHILNTYLAQGCWRGVEHIPQVTSTRTPVSVMCHQLYTHSNEISSCLDICPYTILIPIPMFFVCSFEITHHQALNSDTIYLKTASDPTGLGLSPHGWPSATLQMPIQVQLSPVLLTNQL